MSNYLRFFSICQATKQAKKSCQELLATLNKLEDIRIYGSYSTSSNKKGSDLDFLVQYSGTMKEDVAFNMFADSNLSITDKNGNDVKVDINPINSSLSGTIDEHLDYYDNLEPAKKHISNVQQITITMLWI